MNHLHGARLQNTTSGTAHSMLLPGSVRASVCATDWERLFSAICLTAELSHLTLWLTKLVKEPSSTERAGVGGRALVLMVPADQLMLLSLLL